MGKVVRILGEKVDVTTVDWVRTASEDGPLSDPKRFRGVMFLDEGIAGKMLTVIKGTPTRPWMQYVVVFMLGVIAMACWTASIATFQ